MPTKILILVRHGQYVHAGEKTDELLTALGRQQAKYIGKRLKEHKVDRIVHSTMPRAVETARIIKAQMGYRKTLESCASLCECVPGFPKALRKKAGFTNEKMLKKHQAQADRAFKRYFKTSREDRVEVLVCHGNIIRYLLCKVLGIDTLKWREFDIQQCGISVVKLKSTGTNRRVVISHNDIGHIPLAKRTFL